MCWVFWFIVFLIKIRILKFNDTPLRKQESGASGAGLLAGILQNFALRVKYEKALHNKTVCKTKFIVNVTRDHSQKGQKRHILGLCFPLGTRGHLACKSRASSQETSQWMNEW